MRARGIKPGFYENEVLGRMSPLAHLLYPYLWMECDWTGRMEYRPVRLKAKAFPYRDADIDKLCDELEAGDLILRYGHPLSEHWLLNVKNFHKHQNPCKKERETPSKFPPPNEDSFKYVSGTVPVRSQNGTGTGSVPLIPDSLILNTSSSNSPAASGGLAEEAKKEIEEIYVFLNGKRYSLQAVKQRIVDVYNESIQDHPSWRRCSKIPKGKNGETLEARAKEADWVLSFRKQMEMAVQIDWLKNRTLISMLWADRQRQILDGEWAPSETSKVQQQKATNYPPPPQDDITFSLAKQRELQELSDAKKQSAGAGLF